MSQQRFMYALDDKAATKLIREAMDTLYSPSFLTRLCMIEAPYSYYDGIIPRISDIFRGEERKMAYQFLSGMFSSPDSLPEVRMICDEADMGADWNNGVCYTLFIDADRALGVAYANIDDENGCLLFSYNAEAIFREGRGAKCQLKVEFLAFETDEYLSSELSCLYDMMAKAYEANEDSNWCFYSFHE